MEQTIKEATDYLLDVFMTAIETTTRRVFNDKGEVLPMVILLLVKYDHPSKHFYTDTYIMDATLFFEEKGNENGQLKNLLAKTVKNLVKELKPLASCFISEMWLNKVAGDDAFEADGSIKEKYLWPSKSPTRIEGLQLKFDTFGKERPVIYLIKRPPGQKPYLEKSAEHNGDWQDVNEDPRNQFRFNNLFEDAEDTFSRHLNDGYKYSKN